MRDVKKGENGRFHVEDGPPQYYRQIDEPLGGCPDACVVRQQGAGQGGTTHARQRNLGWCCVNGAAAACSPGFQAMGICNQRTNSLLTAKQNIRTQARINQKWKSQKTNTIFHLCTATNHRASSCHHGGHAVAITNKHPFHSSKARFKNSAQHAALD